MVHNSGRLQCKELAKGKLSELMVAMVSFPEMKTLSVSWADTEEGLCAFCESKILTYL